jgi:hypothetical protein
MRLPPRGIGGSKHFAVMSGVAAVVGCCCAVDTQDEVESMPAKRADPLPGRASENDERTLPTS